MVLSVIHVMSGLIISFFSYFWVHVFTGFSAKKSDDCIYSVVIIMLAITSTLRNVPNPFNLRIDSYDVYKSWSNLCKIFVKSQIKHRQLLIL